MNSFFTYFFLLIGSILLVSSLSAIIVYCSNRSLSLCEWCDCFGLYATKGTCNFYWKIRTQTIKLFYAIPMLFTSGITCLFIGMSRRNRDLLDEIKFKISMSAQISKTDKDYTEYAGASYETANRLAKLKVFIDEKLLPPSIIPMVKLYYRYLQQQRKSFFASVGSTEITKLGFIQGDVRTVKRATDPAN